MAVDVAVRARPSVGGVPLHVHPLTGQLIGLCVELAVHVLGTQTDANVIGEVQIECID